MMPDNHLIRIWQSATDYITLDYALAAVLEGHFGLDMLAGLFLVVESLHRWITLLRAYYSNDTPLLRYRHSTMQRMIVVVLETTASSVPE